MKWILIFLIFYPCMLFAQNLEEHKWNNRILLIISQYGKTEELPATYVQQITAVKNALQGYADRKMIIYSVFPDKYKQINLEDRTESEWIGKSTLFDVYNKDNKTFKVILIGLDGFIKETRNSFFPTDELFDVIDRMPMRKAELKK